MRLVERIRGVRHPGQLRCTRRRRRASRHALAGGRAPPRDPAWASCRAGGSRRRGRLSGIRRRGLRDGDRVDGRRRPERSHAGIVL